MVFLVLSLCIAFVKADYNLDHNPWLDNNLIPVETERILGEHFYKNISNTHVMVQDIYSNNYLQGIVDRLWQSSPWPIKYKPKVLLIKQSDINAFATCGGYIYLYTGIFDKIDNEKQLAGVLAHELSHYILRHIPKHILAATQLNNNYNLLNVGFILAGAATSAFTGGFSLAIMNAMLLNNHYLISESLSYSRTFEKQADSMGKQLLIDSGFDPNSLVYLLNLFNRLETINNLDASKYYRTHPYSSDRIIDLSNNDLLLEKKKLYQSSEDFYFFRYRNFAMQNINDNFYLPSFLQKDIVKHWSLSGLSNVENIDIIAAKELLSRHSESEFVLLLLLHMMEKLDRLSGKDIDLIKLILNSRKNNPYFILMVSSIYYKNNKYDLLLDVLEDYEDLHTICPDIYHYKSMLFSNLGDVVKQNFYQAVYLFLTGNYKLAKESLLLAKQTLKNDDVFALKILMLEQQCNIRINYK